jgi:hypothetical protein
VPFPPLLRILSGDCVCLHHSLWHQAARGSHSAPARERIGALLEAENKRSSGRGHCKGGYSVASGICRGGWIRRMVGSLFNLHLSYTGSQLFSMDQTESKNLPPKGTRPASLVIVTLLRINSVAFLQSEPYSLANIT